MDEIEYKLNTNNCVLVVNAVDKLIQKIKSDFKIEERQRFVLENKELKYLRDKCSAKETVVSLTACQGLLALVELGVLEIAHTMSTIVTLLPTAHNYSAIISTMAGLLILDLKSRLVPGQPYRCQFTLKSPQHPFITVLEKNKSALDDVLAQMQALCTHPDYIVSSNSLELLRPVFLWLTCSPQRGDSRPWQLLLSLPPSTAQFSLLLSCLSCQQICNASHIERAFAAYSTVADTAIHKQDREYVTALLPMLARISNQLVKNGRDPRSCYSLMERCVSLEAAEPRHVAGLALAALADNLPLTSALHLHELLNLSLNIISKYECSSISLNTFVALTLQWLNSPSYLTASSLKVASKIVDIYRANTKEDSRLYMPNLKNNKIFQTLVYTDSRLSVMYKLNETWERVRDDPDKLRSWFDAIESIDGSMKGELATFLIGVAMERRKEDWFVEFVLRALRIVIGLVDVRKEYSVMLMPILMYKIANDPSPSVKMECLGALPVMAKTKENVPNIVSILSKLKANKGVPASFLIYLYTSLAETQVRCFPYLLEVLVDTNLGRADEPKWEADVARAAAVNRICAIRASTHGIELVPIISSILNRCTDRSGSAATALALGALGALWRGAVVAPPGTWRALEPKLAATRRPLVRRSLCKLLSEVPLLRVSTPEYDKLVTDAARQLWTYIADSNEPDVIEEACDALGNYKIDDYKLKDVPEIYRRCVKLPAAYCKTPAEAARRPEDVLDYIPCEVWPEVFKNTNQAALSGVQRLATKLIDREVRAYRSGVYQLDAKAEPPSLDYLPSTSVVRGLVNCFKKQATSPSYDFPDAVLLAILQTLTAEYPKPLPPVDLCFLHELFHRGSQWTAGCLRLAARQAQTTGSAQRLLQNYLQGIVPGTTSESEILQLFELLPILCRGVPPKSLRDPIERCLSDSFAEVVNLKTKNLDEPPLFVKQMDLIRECLECDKIHDANRTLMSQFVEHYFAMIPDDCVAWPTYVRTCCALSTQYLERMTSPSGWWEVTASVLRKAVAVRASLAEAGGCDALLVWLNEVIDAQASQITEQQYSLQWFLRALKAAPADGPHTRAWLQQLMARTQVAYNETEDLSAKLYLFDVFMLSVIVFSGHWALSAPASDGCRPVSDWCRLVSDRPTARALLPAAAASLLARDAWADCVPLMVEWVSHTRDNIGDAATSACCQRTLLALHQHKIWTKLEAHFGTSTTNLED